MNAKQRAIEIFNQHIALASTDGRAFRKTVLEQLKAETGCSQAAASTHYNTAKRAAGPITGLGRAPQAKGVRKPGKGKTQPTLQADNECFTVLELVKNEAGMTVGRCQSFLLQGDASECFDRKTVSWPNNNWVMIQGLGPNFGDNYRLDSDEKEIKRYSTEQVTA
jgi:hypothetical protein